MEPLRQNPWTALVLPFEFSDDGNSVGPHTIGRLERLVSASRCDGYNISKIIVTSGYPLVNRDPRQQRTFASMMKEWLINEGTFHEAQIITSHREDIWTSWQEICEALRIIKIHDFSRNVLVVSTFNHIYPRLWITLRILFAGNPKWHVRFATTRAYRVGMKHELAGTVVYLPRTLITRLLKQTLD